MELIVIGTTAFLPGFALAGVRKTVLASQQTVLDRIAEHRDAGIIILDEELTLGLEASQREQIETSVAPVIVTMGRDGTSQTERLRRAIINTLGVDLLK